MLEFKGLIAIISIETLNIKNFFKFNDRYRKF